MILPKVFMYNRVFMWLGFCSCCVSKLSYESRLRLLLWIHLWKSHVCWTYLVSPFVKPWGLNVHCAQASVGEEYQMFVFCYSLVLWPNSYVNRRLCGTAGSPATSGILHVQLTLLASESVFKYVYEFTWKIWDSRANATKPLKKICAQFIWGCLATSFPKIFWTC